VGPPPASCLPRFGTTAVELHSLAAEPGRDRHQARSGGKTAAQGEQLQCNMISPFACR
jgi:hypothetical protein